MLKRSRLSIRATVLVAIALGMALPALLVLELDRSLARGTLESATQRNREALLALSASVVAKPAWELSAAGLKLAVDRVLQDPSVCAADVLDLLPTTPPLVVRARKCDADHPIVQRETVLSHDGQAIGRLVLAFDDTEIDRTLAERRRVAALLVALQVVVGVAVLAGVLSVRLLRPIDQLKRQARLLAAREPMPALEWRRGDELGELGRHLDQAHGQLQSLIVELESKNQQLHRMAMYDHLTGLPNRTLLRELFSHEASSARRAQRALALLFIDLDHFKAVNDTLGHAAGDELLITVAQRLAGTLRESDLLCRMGGDEFLVLLPQIEGWDHVAATAERLLRAVEAPVALTGNAAGTRVTASIGVAIYPADGADFDALVRTADIAMYRSKDLGRARYSFFHADLDTAYRSRLELERELQQAIEQRQFLLHWQPVFDTARGVVVGCEALLRWQHPQRGLLLPAEFIDTAEHTGLIGPIGLWVLDAACAQLARWQASGPAPLRIAVNVSALQLRDGQFEAALLATLERHSIAPGVLELELTESALLTDTPHALHKVTALRAAGTRLVIDDFGTGYSSLSYLKRLRPDKIKIDRSFVRDLPGDRDDRALTEAIIGIARALGIDVVAEGVETSAQRELLLALGCTLQQGFLFARPLPAEGFAALLVAQAEASAPAD